MPLGLLRWKTCLKTNSASGSLQSSDKSSNFVSIPELENSRNFYIFVRFLSKHSCKHILLLLACCSLLLYSPTEGLQFSFTAFFNFCVWKELILKCDFNISSSKSRSIFPSTCSFVKRSQYCERFKSFKRLQTSLTVNSGLFLLTTLSIW